MKSRAAGRGFRCTEPEGGGRSGDEVQYHASGALGGEV